jgi:hypothetical protein
LTRLLTVSALLLCPLMAWGQTYDLRQAGDDKPVAGSKVLEEEVERQEMAMTILQGDQVLQEQQGTEGFEQTFLEEILEVDDQGELVRATRTYTRFVDLESGESLDGELTVEMSRGEDGSYSLGPLPEDRPIPDLLRAKLQSAVAKKNAPEDEEQRDPEEVFTPAEPVAVGATWTVPPLEALAGLGLNADLDVEGSSCAGTLVSAEEEGGTTWLNVKIDLTLKLLTLDGSKCPDPIMWTMTLELKLPDGGGVTGQVRLTGNMKGSMAPPDAPPGMLVKLNMDMTGIQTRTRQ